MVSFQISKAVEWLQYIYRTFQKYCNSVFTIYRPEKKTSTYILFFIFAQLIWFDYAILLQLSHEEVKNSVEKSENDTLSLEKINEKCSSITDPIKENAINLESNSLSKNKNEVPCNLGSVHVLILLPQQSFIPEFITVVIFFSHNIVIRFCYKTLLH